jgi:hypothetical protein
MHRGIAGIGFSFVLQESWIDAADPLIMRPPMPKRNPQQSTRRRKEASAASSRGPVAGSLLLFWTASGIGPPGPKAGRRPPLNRTSAINASGSSSYGFAPKAVHHFP